MPHRWAPHLDLCDIDLHDGRVAALYHEVVERVFPLLAALLLIGGAGVETVFLLLLLLASAGFFRLTGLCARECVCECVVFTCVYFVDAGESAFPNSISTFTFETKHLHQTSTHVSVCTTSRYTWIRTYPVQVFQGSGLTVETQAHQGVDQRHAATNHTR